MSALKNKLLYASKTLKTYFKHMCTDRALVFSIISTSQKLCQHILPHQSDSVSPWAHVDLYVSIAITRALLPSPKRRCFCPYPLIQPALEIDIRINISSLIFRCVNKTQLSGLPYGKIRTLSRCLSTQI